MPEWIDYLIVCGGGCCRNIIKITIIGNDAGDVEINQSSRSPLLATAEVTEAEIRREASISGPERSKTR